MTIGDSNPQPLDQSLVQQWIARVVDAFNAHDMDRFAAVATDDVVFDHSASPTTMRGLAEVRSFDAANWTAFPDVRVEVDDGPFLHPHAPKASVLWRAIGTNTGPLDMLGLAPTGKRIEIAVCEFAEFRGELVFVCRTRIIIDMADFLGQLGVLPPSQASPS
jgi:steroid delta-isomerase-like uncharacterized protein